MLLLIICQSWASPTLGDITKCCFDGANAIDRIGPVPDTVIVRICDGNGTGSHPVNGTNNGTVYPSHQAVADRTVMLSNELSFSACSEMGRSQEINYKTERRREVFIKNHFLENFEQTKFKFITFRCHGNDKWTNQKPTSILIQCHNRNGNE